MTIVRKCKATLKTGKPCRYKAKHGGNFCGNHSRRALAKTEMKEHEAKAKAQATRDAKIALIVSTVLALIEIIEKVATHFPTVMKLLEYFRENTGNRWHYQETIQGLKAVVEYKSKGKSGTLWKYTAPGDLGRDKIATAADHEYAALVMAIHYIALTHWATSTALAHLSDYDGEFRRYGGFWTNELVKLSSSERDALLQIYKTCRHIPFVDDLYPRNFGVKWRGGYLSSIDCDSEADGKE